MIKPFREISVNGNRRGATATFFGLPTIPFVREKSFEGDEKKRAKSPALAFNGIEVSLLQQPEEKLLGEIFGVLRRVTAPARECIKWIPIGAAEFFETGIRLRRGGIARGENDGPMRRHECRLPGNLVATFR